jgi:hypothetical protein
VGRGSGEIQHDDAVDLHDWKYGFIVPERRLPDRHTLETEIARSHASVDHLA